MDEIPRTRLDKWLWAARFFKTRALATEAVNGGKVEVNGQRGKPGRAVKVGDRLVIRRTPETFLITVLLLSEQRGPASVAQTLYVEDDESRIYRQEQRQKGQMFAIQTPGGSRPTKRDRRRMIQDRGF